MRDSEKEEKESSDDKRGSCHGNPLPSVLQNNEAVSKEDDLNFHIPIYKKIQIRIFKPLLVLKFIQLLWFGATFALDPFIPLYFKQRGMTLSELSIIYIAATPIQFLIATLSGVIADKIGSVKPVLFVNVLIATASLFSMLLIPSMNHTDCDSKLIQQRYSPSNSNIVIVNASCGINEIAALNVKSCHVSCPQNFIRYCFGEDKTCDIHRRKEQFVNFSLVLHINDSHTSETYCLHNVDCVNSSNSRNSWCDVTRGTTCSISCTLISGEKCSVEGGYRSVLFAITLMLMVLHLTTSTCGHRLVNVAVVTVVKEHKKNFGREYVWRIMGTVIFTTLSGYIVSATTTEGQPENYVAAFYLYGTLVGTQLILLCALKIQKTSPSKNMWKKAALLLKNPDILVTLCLLLVLSTIRSFSKQFLSWYLEDLEASSELIGLVMALGSLYSIPFLINSNWWVKNIGTINIFLLSCLGNAAYCLGYSFLQNPLIAIALEAITVLTMYLLFMALMELSHSVAPEGLVSTVIAAVGAFYYNIGRGTGSLIGGQVMSVYGGRIAFRVLALMSLVSAMLYYIYLRITRLHMKGEQDFTQRPDQVKVGEQRDAYKKEECNT